jgi:hypothetical protein
MIMMLIDGSHRKEAVGSILALLPSPCLVLLLVSCCLCTFILHKTKHSVFCFCYVNLPDLHIMHPCFYCSRHNVTIILNGADVKWR